MSIKSRSLLLAIGVILSAPAQAEPAQHYPALVYDATSRPVPIPPSERALQTITAEPWLPISVKTPGLSGLANRIVLEGPAFDRQGNLMFVEVVGGRVMRVSPDRKVDVLLPRNEFGSAGISIHKDGRLFVAGVGHDERGASIFSIKPDGSGREVVVPSTGGFIPDDLTFDSKGGFYFTDVKGSNARPNGAVLYMAPDMKTVTPVLSELSMPNGVALSPDGKVLWVGEIGRNLLHRIELSSPTTIARWGSTTPYHFTGGNPDSFRVDGDGNLYVGMMGSGRVLVFDASGVPIGQILMPDRDKGKHLYTSSVAIRPGTKEIYIMASEIDGSEAVILRATAFAQASRPFSHE